MNYFVMISLLLVGYYIAVVIRNPHEWLSYLHLLPVAVFMFYARAYGMNERAWVGAFELGGVVAALVIALLWHHNVIMDRIMLGLNIFLMLGGAGFLGGIDTILDWYSMSKGGPLFSCIAAIGLITTFCSPRGFVGVLAKKKGAVNYASFLLLAATFIALVWSVSAEDYGLLWAVVLPFITLRVMKDQLVEHIL